mmetsp:Transcript_28666/g.51025  ORF Transcript_28666/g.51025 Transcript_28666/m.51025 type:complete len:466 (-) Transcript_28666:2-1399(-)
MRLSLRAIFSLSLVSASLAHQMQIVSWNINGLGALTSSRPLESILNALDADIICLQEIKLDRERLGPEHIELTSYYSFYHFSATKRANGGVATFVRKGTAVPVDATLGFSLPEYLNLDNEGRVLVTDHSDFLVMNVYFPLGGSPERIAYKVWFMLAVQEHLETFLVQGKHVILAGDLNFAARSLDHWNPEISKAAHGLERFGQHRGRIWLKHLTSKRFVDTFRAVWPGKKQFTYWKDNEARRNNEGARVDYIITDKKFADKYLENCRIEGHVAGSDHCPVRLIVNILLQSNMPDRPPRACAIYFNEFEYKADTQAKLVDMGEGAVPIPKTPQFVKSKRKIVDLQQTAPQQSETQDAPKAEENGVPYCNHQELCQKLQVKKDGRNQGREFYACRRPPGHPHDPESRCNFFKWADQKRKKAAASDSQKCHHGLEAKKSKVKKEGKNQGKWFFHCGHPSENCNFFAWV